MTTSMPPHVALLAHRVADVERWKAGFDDHEPARRAAGILGHHIHRAEGDPHLISLFLALSDLDRAQAFAASPELSEVMQRVGVVSAPDVRWLRPLRDQIVWDRQLPAFVLRHRVADVDTWLAGYDAAAALQRSAGIIGHGAAASVDDPSSITVYHQAETFAELRGFLADPQLQTVMRDAGVISEPEVSFHTGGWGKTY
jgi:hypothetical protein